MAGKLHPKDTYLKNIPGAIPRVINKKKKTKTSGPKEQTIQDEVDNYCNSVGIKYIRIPNTAYSVLFGTPSIPIHVKALMSSYLKGIPDTTCLKPYKGYNLALLLELKKKGGKLSQGQKNWHKGLNVAVCNSIEDAIKTIKDFQEFN